jgi:C4-dicarboxylate transporter DctQ subunit
MQTPSREEGASLFPETGTFERAIAYLAHAGAAVAAVAVLVSLATTSYGVFMRYVLGTPVTWVDELAGYLVVAIVMFGAAEALRRGDHIRVDLLTSRLSGIWLKIMRLVWGGFVIALMGALTISGWVAVTFSYDFGMYSEGYLEMPMWIPQSMLIIGAVLTILTALARIGAALADKPDTP